MPDPVSIHTARRTLLAHAPSGAYAVQPLVTLPTYDSTCAVLSINDDGTATVYAIPGGLEHLPASTPTEPITDPLVAAGHLRAALHHAGTELLKARAAVEREYNERAGDLTGNLQTRARMRAHLIGTFKTGDLSRDGLDEFLQEFDLPPHEPRVKVAFTVTGTFEVYGDDLEEAESDAREYLLAAVRDVPLLVTDSEDVEATIRHTELVELAD